MPSMVGRNAPKGPIGKLRALARAILSASAEEEMRLQRQDLLKINSNSPEGRLAAGSGTRATND